MEKLFIYGFLAACLYGFNADRASAESNKDVCSGAQYALELYLCSDPALKQGWQKLSDVLTNTYSLLSAEESQTLTVTEFDWFNFIFPRQCGLYKPRDLGQRAAARSCLLHSLEQRRLILSTLPINRKTPAYQLSPLERFVVRDYAEAHSNIANMFWINKPMMNKSLNRLVSEVIIPGDAIDEFNLAIGFAAGPIEFTDGRFAFGGGCVTHACPAMQGYIVADTKTGDIVFAINEPGKQLTIFEKSCTDDKLKKFALKRFQGTGPLAGYNDFKFESEVDVETTNCR